MYIILGGTGHVGSAVAQSLLDAGESVTIVTRDPGRAAPWRGRGAALAQADVRDVERLREVLRQSRRAFLLNPPADPSTDTDAIERCTAGAIVAALKGSGLEMVVAQSTGGARSGGPCGDLNVLHEFEQKLQAQPIPARIVRAGYHYSNWDASVEIARSTGLVETPLLPDRPIPMVDPADVGRHCAQLLQGAVGRSVGMIEGPRRLTAREVIAAIGEHLGRPVGVRQVDRADLEDWFRKAGFSGPAARSYACMTRTLWDEQPDERAPIRRGPTTFKEYMASLFPR